MNGDKITIKIKKEHRGVFKEIISNIKGNILTGKVSPEALKKQILKQNKELGLPRGASIFSKTTYGDIPKDFKETYEKIQDTAKNQNHMVSTAIEHYINWPLLL